MQQEQIDKMTYSYKLKKIEEGIPIATFGKGASIGFVAKLIRSKKIMKYFDNRKWLYEHNNFLRAFFLIDTCSQNNLLDYFQDDLIRDYKLEESWNWGVFDPFELSLEINILRDTSRPDKIKKQILKNILSKFKCNELDDDDIPF